MQLVTYSGRNGSRERTVDNIGSKGGRGARLDLSRVCSHHHFHGQGQLPSFSCAHSRPNKVLNSHLA